MAKYIKEAFLVVLRQTMDDIPMGLFINYDAAHDFALALDWNDWMTLPEGFDFTTSESTAISIVTFHNGKPIRSENVREFDDEDFEDNDP